jgi:hypothetical protein
MGVKGTRSIPGLGTSPLTSLAGYCAGGAVLLGVVESIARSFPEGGGVADLVRLIWEHSETIVQGLAVMGLGVVARQNNVSSEQAGAK